MPKYTLKVQYWLPAYGVLVLSASFALYQWMRVDREPAAPKALVYSWWKNGERVERELHTPTEVPMLGARSVHEGTTQVIDEILDEGPVLGRAPLTFGGSFVPKRDGVKVVFRNKVAYLTPDDLLRLHAYDREVEILGVTLVLGVDRDRVLDAAAAELEATPAQLLAEATFRRVAMRHHAAPKNPTPDVTTLQQAVAAASDYLARQVKADGTFQYEIDAITGEPVPGYNWPRHAGATWFLARVAAYEREQRLARSVTGMSEPLPSEHEQLLGASAVRAANKLIKEASLRCGPYRCIGEGPIVDIGSAALTLMALCDIHEARLMPDVLHIIRELSDFIRSLQRADGEFAHSYDRENSRAIDEQFPYYSGEATLALSQAHRVTANPADLRAAASALNYLVTRPRLFITWKYLWAAEHWTCQAVTDLWQRAPNQQGKEFCIAWQRFNRGSTSRDPEYAGASGRFLFRSVPLTGAASSTEAAAATLALSRLTPMPNTDVRELEFGVRRSLALLLRHQFQGTEYLMRNPEAMRGGMPASTVDLKARIDYAQHAGSAWLSYLRWLRHEPWEI